MQIPLKKSVELHSFEQFSSFCNLYGNSFGHSSFSFLFIIFKFVSTAFSGTFKQTLLNSK